ncbi:MAG: glycosyltransferase [Promethearchaeota archaeon]
MKRKISIGIFTIMLSETNGTAEAARRLIIGLGNAGHDVHVFAPSNGVVNKRGVIFHKAWGFRMSREPEFHFGLPFFDYFKVRQVDYLRELEICHAITPTTLGALGLNHAKFLGLPKIVTHHSPLQYYGKYFPIIGPTFGFYAWKYERLFYNRFHVIHVPTLTKKKLIMHYKMKEPIFALTNGISDNYFIKRKDSKSLIHDLYGIPKDKKIILYAGRQGYEKNIEAIIRALRGVRDRGIDTHLILAGGGPHIPVLWKYARSLGLLDHLTQTGWVKHKILRSIYDAADVSTLFSFIEAQGLVLLEAMAQGTPCVGANATGISDVIIDGVTGYLANNEDEFIDRIYKLLSNDELRREMGKKAREHVIEYHKMSNVIKVWEKIYRFMIDKIYPMHAYRVPEPEIVEEWREFVAKEPLLSM